MSDNDSNEKPKTFELKPGETAVIQFVDGTELDVDCVETTGTKATLAISPGGDVKRVMKIVR